ncbi:MAG: hypothetical protein WAZ77_08655 [Candidatus Nitrosopolaris sp.]
MKFLKMHGIVIIVDILKTGTRDGMPEAALSLAFQVCDGKPYT